MTDTQAILPGLEGDRQAYRTQRLDSLARDLQDGFDDDAFRETLEDNNPEHIKAMAAEFDDLLHERWQQEWTNQRVLEWLLVDCQKQPDRADHAHDIRTILGYYYGAEGNGMRRHSLECLMQKYPSDGPLGGYLAHLWSHVEDHDHTVADLLDWPVHLDSAGRKLMYRLDYPWMVPRQANNNLEPVKTATPGDSVVLHSRPKGANRT